MAFLEETREWKRREFINFEKVRDVGTLLKNFGHFQTAASQYRLPIKEPVQEYLLTTEIWDEEDLFHLAQLKSDSGNLSFKNVDLIETTGKDASPSYATRRGLKKYVTGRSNIATDIESLSTREWDLLLTNATVVDFKVP